ncbi:MAG: glycosyltransferase [Ruminococcus sp.]|nr:glycosyltransferase [Ruminococcus sp.]
MKKILFFIPNLSHGGAEKVLVNLVNNMDRSKFDITVQTLFAGGVNEQFLKKDIKYKYCFKKTFRGNSQILKLFSPQRLYKRFIKEKYDIIVSYLEGPTARVVSGCTDKDTKLVSWIHVEQHTQEKASHSFKNYKEAKKCYEKFDNTICVSNYVKEDFTKIFNFQKPIEVLYNTNETKQILELANEGIEGFNYSGIKICAIGTLKKSKGFDRLIRVQKRLIDDGLDIKFFILGEGPEKENLINIAKENNVEDTFIWLGYKTNPYKYISKCDLLVCASFVEGFSTATTEALILGVPVVTVEVSGMKEMLGENNEYGIVTENNEDALYEGIKKMLTTNGLLAIYAEKAKERGKSFSTEKTVKSVEVMLERL